MSDNFIGTKLKTNLDTNLLKVVAIISMFIDHIGVVFFPDQIIYRIVGRIAFPIFSYCLTVGLLYTKNIKMYLLRLALFAFVSQPFWVLGMNAEDIWGNIFILNIFFTLFINLLALWGFKERKWWLFAISIVTLCFANLDYSLEGIVLMLIFYLCRNKPKLGLVLYIAYFIPSLFGITNDEILVIGNYSISIGIFSVLAAPFIFINTNSKIKISKWFFYIFYPAHLLMIYIVGLL